jgi:DNA-nicking Smr family endonuclease
MVKQRSTDVEAFRAAVRDVTPLAQTPAVEGLATPKPRARRRKDTEPLVDTAPLVGGLPADEAAEAADAVTGDEALSFQRGSVRIQAMRRLRRGLYPIDDELDLHGLSQSAARSELAPGRHGIRFCACNGRRCRCDVRAAPSLTEVTDESDENMGRRPSDFRCKLDRPVMGRRHFRSGERERGDGMEHYTGEGG